MGARSEADLYGPIKAYLQERGFEVKGEVSGCDLVAVRGADLVVVELKAAFNLALLLQGVERQKVADEVYLAVEAPRSRRSGPRWSQIRHLCRRLGLGLITVLFTPGRPVVEVVCHPEEYIPRRSRKKRAALLREFERRSGDYNTGGVTRRPVVTAYREEALRLAACLHRTGPARVKALREATGVQGAGRVLQRNVYGWFERVSTGVYRLTPAGEEALRVYADVVAAAEEAGSGMEGPA